MNESFSQPVKCLALAIHPHYHRAEEALALIDQAAKKHGIEVVRFNNDGVLPENSSCRAIVSVGGDGTLLAAVHRTYPSDIPVWGVNVGHLGFLTTSGMDGIEPGMEALSRGAYAVERRSMIEADAFVGSETPVHTVALNDIVIHRDITKGQLTLNVDLNGRFLASYEGDGLIVATPTGSTAYALSAGGPILSPGLAALLLTPVCSPSLSARSLVFDDSSELAIRPKFISPGALVQITADGQPAALIKGGTDWQDINRDNRYKVIVRRSDRTAGLVRFQEVVFSDVLRDKLGWAGVSPLRRTT